MTHQVRQQRRWMTAKITGLTVVVYLMATLLVPGPAGALNPGEPYDDEPTGVEEEVDPSTVEMVGARVDIAFGEARADGTEMLPFPAELADSTHITGATVVVWGEAPVRAIPVVEEGSGYGRNRSFTSLGQIIVSTFDSSGRLWDATEAEIAGFDELFGPPESMELATLALDKHEEYYGIRVQNAARDDAFQAFEDEFWSRSPVRSREHFFEQERAKFVAGGVPSDDPQLNQMVLGEYEQAVHKGVAEVKSAFADLELPEPTHRHLDAIAVQLDAGVDNIDLSYALFGVPEAFDEQPVEPVPEDDADGVAAPPVRSNDAGSNDAGSKTRPLLPVAAVFGAIAVAGLASMSKLKRRGSLVSSS